MLHKTKYLICAFLYLLLNAGLGQAQSAPAWVNAHAGINALNPNYVPPPYAPLVVGQSADGYPRITASTADGKVVKNYYLDSYGFLSQVEINGVNFMPQDMSLYMSINGDRAYFEQMHHQFLTQDLGMLKYKSTANIYILNKGAMVWVGSYYATTIFTYDGLVQISFTIQPTTNFSLTGLSYTVNYPDNQGAQQNVSTSYIRWDAALNLSSGLQVRNYPAQSYYLSVPPAPSGSNYTTQTIWNSAFKTGFWGGTSGDVPNPVGLYVAWPSMQYWSPQLNYVAPFKPDPKNNDYALTFQRSVQNGLQLIVTPVSSPETLTSSSPATYTFLLNGTPLIPFDLNARGLTYSGWPGFGIPTGVGNIELMGSQKDYTQWPFFPEIRFGFNKEFINLVSQLNQEGQQLSPYVDPTIINTSENIPDLKYLGNYLTSPGLTWHNDGATEQRATLYDPAVQDMMLRYYEVLATIAPNFDDIDEWQYDYDQNQANGAGYIDQNGVLQNTYDILQKRAFMERLAYILMIEGKNPNSMIVAHTESMTNIAIITNVKEILTGENTDTNYYTNASKPSLYFDQYSQDLLNSTQASLKAGGTNWYAAVATKDSVEGQIATTRSWGFPVFVMSNYTKSPYINSTYANSDEATEDFLASYAPFDVNIADMWIKPDFVHYYWAARQNFGITDPGIAYISPNAQTPVATTPQANVVISAYYNSNHKTYLITIANQATQQEAFKAQLNPSLFSNVQITSFYCAMPILDGTQKVGQQIPIFDNTFNMTLPARSIMVIEAQTTQMPPPVNGPTPPREGPFSSLQK